MFAMLALHRVGRLPAFRAKNLEAFLLLFTAFIVLLGQIYAGIWISDLPQLPTAAQLVEAGEQDNACTSSSADFV